MVWDWLLILGMGAALFALFIYLDNLWDRLVAVLRNEVRPS